MARRCFVWLKTVAVHEAYRLHHADHASVSWQVVTGGDENADACTSARLHQMSEDRLEGQLEARRALRASRPPGQAARVPVAEGGRISLDEIRELAGGASLTNVNKHLVRARRRMRDARAA